MKVQFVPEEELSALAATPVIFTPSFRESDFALVWETVRDRLRRELGRSWKESPFGDRDFAIGDDRSNNWIQAGAIYSRQALCGAFIPVAAAAIAGSKHPDRWAVHFSIELWMHEEPRAASGEFLLKSGTLYLPKETKFDYAPVVKSLSPDRSRE